MDKIVIEKVEGGFITKYYENVEDSNQAVHTTVESLVEYVKQHYTKATAPDETK